MIRPSVQRSLKAHLTENVFTDARLSTSPVVVFHSKPGATRQAMKPVNDFCSMFHGLLQNQHVNANHNNSGAFSTNNKLDVRFASISSKFPTFQDVHDAQEFVLSTGASTVIGVGSGVAMDLVKSVKADNKILVPATSAAVFAANTSYSLLLDMEQNVLQVESLQNSSNIISLAERGTIAKSPDTVVACRSILLDACYRRDPSSQIPDLELTKWALELDPLVQGVISTSTQMNTTSSDKKILSNAPLTLAALLLPAFFPRASMFSFWASLLPGLASLHNHTIYRDQFPHLQNLATMPVSAEMLMGQIVQQQQNNTTDTELANLEQILSVSLAREM